jgi:hypothetical protein
MIIESSVTGIKPNASLVETVKIMDEMDRLLNEMRETMSTIKSLLDEEAGVESLLSPPLTRCLFDKRKTLCMVRRPGVG